MIYQRPLFQLVKSRLEEPRLCLQVIVGPRQVGKSTLIQQVMETIPMPQEYYSADDVITDNQLWLTNIWENARLRMQRDGETERLLVVDEVQKIANWSEIVKAEWDRDTREYRNLKIVLLGSSRMLIMQGLTESLAGRFELIRVPQWTYAEMKDAFGWSVEQYIYYGGYPGVVHYVQNPLRWKQYVKDALIEPAIAKDVLVTTRIQKPQLLRQLFEIGCSYSGELLALKKIAAQLQDAGNSTTLAGYLTLLQEAGLLSGLQKYANDFARKYNSIPKFQVHNSALRNVYEDVSFEDAIVDSALWGRLVESAVGAYLVSQSAIGDFQVYYWRDGKDEVDFVLKRQQTLIAIEVKSGRRKMNSGLRVFQETFHPTRTIVVGGEGLSVEEFLLLDLQTLFVSPKTLNR